MALNGDVGGVFAPDSLSGTSVNDETFSGDDSATTFTLANEYVKPYSETVTVDGLEEKRGRDYTINYITGEITFDNAPPSGTDNISVDYTYHTVSEVGGFYEWSVDETSDTLETTDFTSDGHREYVAGLREWTASSSKYWKTTKTFDDWVGQNIIIVFYVDTSNNVRYEGWGVLETKTTDVAVDSVVEASVDMQGSGQLTYRTN